jgi:hypothetical protein
MKVYQLLKRGEYHADFCEDFGLVQQVSGNRWLCAVMDGCTMGQESHFASTLAAKIIRKVLKERQYQAFYQTLPRTPSLQQEVREILEAVFREFQQLRNQLLLDTHELLTTLVVALVDTDTKAVYGLALGDATVALNKQLIRFEQSNKPDYLAYHLGQNFDDWFAQQKQTFQVDTCFTISLATDGIDSFQPTDSASDEFLNIPYFLLVDEELSERDEMLAIKVKRLENRHDLLPTDDLAIVRIQLD